MKYIFLFAFLGEKSSILPEHVIRWIFAGISNPQWKITNSNHSPPAFKWRFKASCWGTLKAGGNKPNLSSSKLPKVEQISSSSSQLAQTHIFDFSFGASRTASCRGVRRLTSWPSTRLSDYSLRRPQIHL